MTRRARRSVAVLGAIAALVGMSACSGGSTTKSTTVTTRPVMRHAVGVVTETFVDRSRPTPRSRANPSRPERTLVTTILYPAAGPATSTTPVADAPAARDGAPYPLVVFAHGLGGNPHMYEAALLDDWASAGYVVAAPTFPLTSVSTPGGPDAGDVVDQPADMSFVITSVLRASAARTGRVAGLVDRDAIAAAGHSNGAITTLGLVANTCCRDKRVKAALVLAGDLVAFPHGRYDLAHAPPMLFVHGTDDAELPYNGMVNAFDEARGPKGFVTIQGGDHASAAMAPEVVGPTEDFLAAYLRDDAAARNRLAHDGEPGVSTIRFVAERGSKASMPAVSRPRRDLHVTVEPSRDLRDGQVVTVTWSGFTPGRVVNIVQCHRGAPTPASCDFTYARLLQADATGSGSEALQIVGGRVGRGICDRARAGCFVAVNDASDQDPSATVIVPITFAR